MARHNRKKKQSRYQEILQAFLEDAGADILYFPPETIITPLFDKQLSLIHDTSRNKVAVTSRRAGKTFACIRYMLYVALSHPDSLIAYLTKTRDWAEQLVWEPLKRLDEEYGLDIQFNTVKLKAVFPNGSVIRLAGAKDKSQAEVLRGFAYKLFIIDEAGSITPDVMQYVLKEVIAAAMGDYDGTLLVVGTPNPSCSGYFHDISTNVDSGFSKHHWTVANNPEYPIWAGKPDWQARVEAFLEEQRKRWGFAEDDPEYQREYKGLWVKSSTNFIFSALPDGYKELPERLPPDLQHILGIDLGYHDEAAFVVLGFSQSEQAVYEIQSFSAPGMDFTNIVAKARTLQTTHKAILTVIDPASGGLHLVQELSNRHNIPAIGADKQHKASWFKLLNSDIRMGRVHYKPSSLLAKQQENLQWNTTYQREAEGQPCDLVDAHLYAYKYAYHYIHKPLPKELTPEEKIFNQTLEQLQSKLQTDIDLYGITDYAIDF